VAIPTIPPTFYQVAFNADPNQGTAPPYFSDVSARVQFPWATSRGRQYELDQNETATWTTVLANSDGALDPNNAASPYSPGVVPLRQARVLCLPGPNLLIPDQATAGEGTGYAPGPVPAQMNVTCGAGYPLTLAASGTAFQGTQVYNVAVPNGAASVKTLLNIAQAAAFPAVAYAAQLQVRTLATAQNLTMDLAIDWYNSAGAVISTTFGPNVAVTGGSTSWTQLTATATAPAGTVYCTLRARLVTTTTSTATFQADGAQFEANPFPTLFQAPNTVSANLFSRNPATGGLAAGAVAGWFAPQAGTVAYATGLTAAPSGHSNACAWTTPAGTTSSSPLTVSTGATVTAGQAVGALAGTPYTFSFYALRAASADATLAVTARIDWYSVTGLVASTIGAALTLSTSVWGRQNVWAVAPAGTIAAVLSLNITTPATTTATNTVYVTGVQFEVGSSPSTWQDPGTAYQIITPYVERWPQDFAELDGTYGTSDIVGDDAFIGLSQFTLPQPFVAELLALAPNFLFQLAEPAGATACTDTAGKRPPAPVENSPFGAGSLTFGNPVASATTPGAFVGSAGPVATFNNNSTSTGTVQLAETFVSIGKTTTSPGPPNTGAWTRLLAFRASAAPAGGHDYMLWYCTPASWYANASLLQMHLEVTGVLGVQFTDITGAAGVAYTGGGSLCDGNWHLVAVGLDPASGTNTVWVDGVSVATAAGVVSAQGFSVDTLGALVLPGSNRYSNGFVGDMAFAAEVPLLLTNAQMTNLYNSWRLASSGESSGARVNRVLTWIGWPGQVAVDTGSTASMGPATDLAGATALDALNNIALTENGNFYTSSAGVLTFKGRNARYNQATPVYVFGGSQTAGEWPFEYVKFGFDPSHLMSDVQVTQYGGPTVTAYDAASRTRSWPRVYQRTVNTTSLPEVADAANYLLSQNKVARQRVDVLRLHPSAVPGLFAVCLNLELGMRIRVNQRPVGAPAQVFDGFIEKIEWSWDPNAGDVWVTLQCSPANLVKYWVLAALHTTLHAQANAGANTISINALPDAATNVLASSLPAGYQLTLDPGNPAIAETVTIAPGGIPSTTVGYASATLTIVGTLAHTHLVNAVVCEALPAGLTDPAAYDSLSVLGAAATTVNVAAGGAFAGTNTVTINALPDAKVNPLAASIPQSWTFWLSPGTPNFEAVTVAATGVPVTYPGWATATLTLTANLAHNHAAGDIVVCEPLPAGDTSPSQVLATTIPAY
jgi:hypothetical protein